MISIGRFICILYEQKYQSDMKVLGVDVGSRVCGYVFSEVKKIDIEIIKEEQVQPNPKWSFPEKLKQIFEVLEKEVIRYNPSAIVVEKLYSHYRHPATLGLLAQIRGVVVLLSQQKEIDLFEYSPTRARKSFLGKGNVSSSQVKKMAENVTGRRFKSVHTADAFSLIVAFSHAQKVNKIISEINSLSLRGTNG